MKKPSVLNSTHIRELLLVLVVAGVAVFLYVSLQGESAPRPVYHMSQWNEYAREVDRAREIVKIAPITLSQVYGGIVPHHIPTTIPRLVEFYTSLKKHQDVEKIIVIGPDHTDAGSSPVSVSGAIYYTDFGDMKPIKGLAKDLEDRKVAVIDEAPFPPEHSVGSQILLISRIFPGARVTPIIIRSDVTEGQAEALGKALASYLDDETILIASVDFSHYLTTDQAEPIDKLSGQVLENLDRDALKMIRADSNGSLVAFVEAMLEKKARETALVRVTNTNDYMQNSDFTTGYVTGYWGMK